MFIMFSQLSHSGRSKPIFVPVGGTTDVAGRPCGGLCPLSWGGCWDDFVWFLDMEPGAKPMVQVHLLDMNKKVPVSFMV